MQNLTKEQLKMVLKTVIEAQGMLSKRMLKLKNQIESVRSEDSKRQLKDELKQLKRNFDNCIEEEHDIKGILEKM